MFWRQIASSKRLSWLVCTSLLLFTDCRNIEEAVIEDLREESRLTDYRMISLTGVRDGDLLPVRVVFKAWSSNLLLDFRFRIGFPTRLEWGQYYWKQDDKILEGQVRARSVTFLGGQSDNPNLGGVFELLAADGAAIYKVTVPTSEVNPPDTKTPRVAPAH